MKNFFKQLIPPLFLELYRDIYFYFLINKNKKRISKDQDIDIYNKSLTAEKLSEWGKETTWNEIQMFFDDKEGKILDVACGTGLNMIDLSRINSKASLYGCDISQYLIDIAVKNGVKKENLFCIDATELNFEEDIFDYSYSIGSMEHFTEDGIDKLIEKLSKITRKASIHMMPVSKKNLNEGWIKTYQTFHNNSVEWWVKKFRKKFSKVDVIDSSWNDHISVGKWFVCYK
jgi:ubiquinone/menaquinone biosynthesis C-methylase UbiE